MKAEAKANEASDKEAKEKVEKLNEADNLIFQTEKQLKEFGDKIPADKKATIESAVERLKEAHKNQDIDNNPNHNDSNSMKSDSTNKFNQ